MRSYPLARRVLPLALFLCLPPAPALAQATAGDQVLAEALFREARTLMDQGKHAEACPKLAESQRLDPGGGTQLALALCLEAAGKTASAYGAFTEARALARRDGRADREKIASERLDALSPRLTKLTVDVSGAARSLPGLSVSVDGVTLREPAWGLALPVDPGEAHVRATAPGRLPFEARVKTAGEGQTARVEVPELAPAPGAASGGEGPVAPAAPPGASPPPDASAGSSRRTAGFVVGGVGLAGLAVGGVFGALALSKNADADAACPDVSCPDPGAVEASASALTFANVSNVAVGVGVLAIGVGAFLVLTSPSEPDPSSARRPRPEVWVGLGARGPALGGRF